MIVRDISVAGFALRTDFATSVTTVRGADPAKLAALNRPRSFRTGKERLPPTERLPSRRPLRGRVLEPRFYQTIVRIR